MVSVKKIAIALTVLTVIMSVSGVAAFVTSGQLEEKGIHYHGNGGTFNGKDMFIGYDDYVYGLVFEYEGKDFKKWTTDPMGRESTDEQKYGVEYMIGDEIDCTKKIDLYAIWVDDSLYSTLHVSKYRDYLIETDIDIGVNLYIPHLDKTYDLSRYRYHLLDPNVDYYTQLTLDSGEEYEWILEAYEKILEEGYIFYYECENPEDTSEVLRVTVDISGDCLVMCDQTTIYIDLYGKDVDVQIELGWA